MPGRRKLLAETPMPGPVCPGCGGPHSQSDHDRLRAAAVAQRRAERSRRWTPAARRWMTLADEAGVDR